MNVALDTNAYTDFTRGNSARVRIVQSARALYLPFVALAELRAGFLSGTLGRSNEAGLQRFLNATTTSVLMPDDGTTHYYAQLVLQLKRQGTPIPTNDVWIAALVLQHNLVLCTSDRHFDHIPQLPKC